MSRIIEKMKLILPEEVRGQREAHTAMAKTVYLG